MKSNWKQYSFLKSPKVLGVEFCFADTEVKCNTIIISRKGKKIDFDNTKSFSCSIKEIDKNLDKKYPLAISLDGKGIIHKKVKREKELTNQQWVNKIFPSASVNDFYLQKFYLNDDYSWVSLIRKEAFNQFLTELLSKGYLISSIILGPFSLHNGLKITDNENTEIGTINHLISASNHDFTINPLSENENYELTIGEEKLNGNYLCAFSNGLNYFIPAQNINEVSTPDYTLSKSESFHKRINHLAMIGFIGFFLLLTLVANIVGDIFLDKNEKLKSSFTANQNLISQLDTLKKELIFKKEFIEANALNFQGKTAYYADDIASTVPSSIRLEVMDFFSPEKKIKEDQEIKFITKSITIKGVVNNSLFVNNWIKELQSFSWVNNVKVISYEQESISKEGTFELIIQLK